MIRGLSACLAGAALLFSGCGGDSGTSSSSGLVSGSSGSSSGHGAGGSTGSSPSGSGPGGSGGSSVTVIPFDIGEGSFPAVSALPGNSKSESFTVSWHTSEGLRANRFAANGTKVDGPDSEVAPPTEATWSGMATNGEGRSLVAWERGNQPFEGPGLEFASLGVDGSLTSLELPLPPPGKAGIGASPTQFLMAWIATDNVVRSRLFNNNGSGQASMTEEIGDSASPLPPAVWGYQDGFLVAWPGAAGLDASFVNQLGFVQGVTFPLGAGITPRGATRPDGRFYVLVTTPQAAGEGTFTLRSFGAPGFPADQETEFAAPDDAATADLAAHPNGRLLVAWSKGTGKDCKEITAQPFTPGLHRVGGISFADGEGCGPVRVAVNEAGDAMLVWQKDKMVRAAVLPGILYVAPPDTDAGE